MYKLYCRIFQNFMRLGCYFLPWRKPEMLEGVHSLKRLPAVFKQKNISKILVVTDENLSKSGLMDPMMEELNREGLSVCLYDKTVPNPPVHNIEEALKMYQENGCKGIIAFGGGSSIDCGKGVAILIARPDKTMAQMKGVLKVRRKIPFLVAVPTTAGSGSEATLAAVISNPATHEKYAINDPSLIPNMAVLDPTITVGLPKQITAVTGIDALTHAVEAYIGKSNTRETKKMAIQATKLIFENIYQAYSKGDDLTARANMQKASFFAGIAFTRAYVGYVHGIAHSLGGFYGTPHGLANSVVLPYVLEAYGKSAHKKLARLADEIKITNQADTNAQKAQKFINAIRQLNASMDIPDKIEGINPKDIPEMLEHAYRESNPLYPVPRIMSRRELGLIYEAIRK